MASSKSYFLLAFPLWLLLLVTSFADDQLIQEECHYADVPKNCIECIKSDPQGESVDKIGIAGILINCLTKHDETLSEDMYSLTLGARGSSTRVIFEDCKKGFDQSKDNLSAAADKLKSGDYDQTNQYIRSAVAPAFVCDNDVKELKEFPSSVLDEMRVYEQLSIAALRIINKF